MSTPMVEKSVKMTLREIVEHLNHGIRKAEALLCLSRSSQLQHEQCLALDRLQYNATMLKHEAIRLADEGPANLFLGFECVIGAVRSELMMYVMLKRDEPNSAWDCLVASQMGYLDATRAAQGFAHCAQRLDELDQLEKVFFPKQVFMSAGFTSRRLDCSICGERSSRCDHLKGQPYMGQLCEYIHRDPIGDHVSIVEVPADKRCRVVSFKTKDGHRDRLTWAITPYKDGEVFEEGSTLEASMTFLALDRYPYLTPTEKIIGKLNSTNAC